MRRRLQKKTSGIPGYKTAASPKLNKEIKRNQSRLPQTSVFCNDMMIEYHNTVQSCTIIDFQAVCGCILEGRSGSRKFPLGACFAGLFRLCFLGYVSGVCSAKVKLPSLSRSCEKEYKPIFHPRTKKMVTTPAN